MTKLMGYLIVSVMALPAHAGPATAVIETYAAKVHAQYTQALLGARILQTAIEQFVQDPSEANLILARSAWLTSRESYSPAEVYRFYGGPIDDEDGPEGALNAWPLDEAYIDYVDGDADAGLIQNPDLYPSLDMTLLRDLNEKDGEKNIATGYHAIEFMLWGQDLYPDSAGRRPYADFVSAPFADRRKAYLRLVAQMLVEDLSALVAEWNPEDPNSFYQTFVDPARENESLTNILTGVANLAGFELSQERMYTALENSDQEDEHSCFSDNTHNDFIYNVKGIATVLNGGVIDLIRARDEAVADELVEALALAEAAMLAIPIPFDQSIQADHPGRPLVMKGVEALENLSDATKQAAVVLGLSIPKPE